MKKIIGLLLISSTVFCDPGIMIDVDIIIHGPTGTGDVELSCK